MAVSTTSYGAWVTHEGTLAEVMGEVLGKPKNYLMFLEYDAGNSKYAAVCHI